MSEFKKRSQASVVVWCLAALVLGFIISSLGCCSTKYRVEFIGKNSVVGVDIQTR